MAAATRDGDGAAPVRDGERVIARLGSLEGIEGFKSAKFVIRFTDDAGRRWQLDGDMHLDPAPRDEW